MDVRARQVLEAMLGDLFKLRRTVESRMIALGAALGEDEIDAGWRIAMDRAVMALLHDVNAQITMLRALIAAEAEGGDEAPDEGENKRGG